MKKIGKLTLSKSQILSKEEQRHVVAGDNWYLTGHTWDCGCVQKGQECRESFYYIGFRSQYSGFYEMPKNGLVYNPKTVGHMEIYTIWHCEGVFNGNKMHKKYSHGSVVHNKPI